MSLEQTIIILKYMGVVLGGYLVSIFVKHILDKKITKLRIDNYILYLLLAKSPNVSTKIIFRSEKRPSIEEIRKKMELEFNLERNEKPHNNSYIFKIRGHPTPMKIRVIEPDSSNLFTINLETLGEDKLPKIFRGSFDKTINYFEKISKKLNQSNLKTINAVVRISTLIEGNKNLTYNYKPNATINSKTINISSKDFTELEGLVRECLTEWRVRFI